jgi:hypothetical protein
MKEIDQFPSVLDKSRLNVVAPPRWVVAIEISGQNKAKEATLSAIHDTIQNVTRDDSRTFSLILAGDFNRQL